MIGGVPGAPRIRRQAKTGSMAADSWSSVEEYVADLTGKGEVEVEKSKPAKLYVRSADSLFKQVHYPYNIYICLSVGLGLRL